MLAPDVAAKAACAAPELRPVVDAAFARQGGPEQRRMETVVCPTCPIARECLLDATENGEWGPWGGTNARTRRQFVKLPRRYNMRDVEYPHHELPAQPLERRGKARQVKEWAVSVGLLPGVARGRVPGWVWDAYDEAHGS